MRELGVRVLNWGMRSLDAIVNQDCSEQETRNVLTLFSFFFLFVVHIPHLFVGTGISCKSCVPRRWRWLASCESSRILLMRRKLAFVSLMGDWKKSKKRKTRYLNFLVFSSVVMHFFILGNGRLFVNASKTKALASCQREQVSPAPQNTWGQGYRNGTAERETACPLLSGAENWVRYARIVNSSTEVSVNSIKVSSCKPSDTSGQWSGCSIGLVVSKLTATHYCVYCYVQPCETLMAHVIRH